MSSRKAFSGILVAIILGVVVLLVVIFMPGNFGKIFANIFTEQLQNLTGDKLTIQKAEEKCMYENIPELVSIGQDEFTLKLSMPQDKKNIEVTLLNPKTNQEIKCKSTDWILRPGDIDCCDDPKIQFCIQFIGTTKDAEGTECKSVQYFSKEDYPLPGSSAECNLCEQYLPGLNDKPLCTKYPSSVIFWYEGNKINITNRVMNKPLLGLGPCEAAFWIITEGIDENTQPFKELNTTNFITAGGQLDFETHGAKFKMRLDRCDYTNRFVTISVYPIK